MTARGADNLDRRACRVAALFAAALLVGTGLAYRAVAARLVDWAAPLPCNWDDSSMPSWSTTLRMSMRRSRW